MKTIWKFEIEITDEQVITVPVHHEFLKLDKIGLYEYLYLWYLVDDEMVDGEVPTVEKTIYVVGTGGPADHVDHRKYLGSVKTHSDKFIWHVFEK